MDGDGSIQVNHWRYKNLQYRLVIKLKYCNENLSMLNLIVGHIGGKVRFSESEEKTTYKFVIWVVDNRTQIQKIIQIFIKYPPLTSRINAQLAFMYECLKKNDIEWYLLNRNKKYLNTNIGNINMDNTYFNEWLSGFIEAEGCFSIRTTSNNHSFSIGQNDDKYILDKIINHFKITNQLKKKKDKFWHIEVYKKSILINIINHCIKYPLLGEKILSLNKIRDLFK